MRLGRWAMLLVLAALVAPAAAAVEPSPADEHTLQAAGLATDGPALLEFFRKRTLTDADRERIEAIVRQLGDERPEVRLLAKGEILGLGTAAVPFLRRAMKDPDDRERMEGARSCLAFIEGTAGAAVPATAARLLAARRPPGAAEVLLAYLPFADNELVCEEVWAALASLARRDGAPEPAVLAALTDPLPVRRAAAAVALATPPHRPHPAVRRLLQDPKPTVRLHVALALARAYDADAVAELIRLLGELPPDQARQAEDFLTRLAGEQTPPVPYRVGEEGPTRCRDAWSQWWQGTAGGRLLDHLRQRTPSREEREKVETLIRRLGDDTFDVREQATTELLALGPIATALLRQAARSADPEVARRAESCLRKLAAARPSTLAPATAARLLAYRRPPGMAAILLDYLPFAEDDDSAAAVVDALAAGARSTEVPDPMLVAALGDPLPLRRAAAGEALGRAGAAEESVAKLLRDPDAGVRLRVGLARAAQGDREALAVLIALLGELSPAQAWPVEELLRRLAGEHGPNLPLGHDEPSRQACRAAWAKWWQARGPQVDLAALGVPRRPAGYTLVVFPEAGKVAELGLDGRLRWQIDGIRYPYDAQALPGDRVLIAEYHGRRVTERNFKGEILWERALHAASLPIACQRLTNGNTFIVSRNLLLEVDRDGKEVLTLSRPGHDILAATKLRTGEILLATSAGTCLRLDAAGQEVKSFVLGPLFQGHGTLEVLPNGRILVPQTGANKVVEFDAEGTLVWEAAVPQPVSAVRLPNGNTLVASQVTQQVLELDRAGRVVWEHRTGADRPWRARRR